jgi:hypothetical protein
MELATMVDRNFRDVYQKLAELPLRRYTEVLRNKAQDLTTMLGDAAYFDQYPSKRVPWIFSRTYGPIPLTATRHVPASEAMPLIAVEGTSTAPGTGNTLVDTTQAWTPNAFVGYTVRLISGAGAPVSRTIASNTPTTLTIVGGWSPPNATTSYQIVSFQSQATGSVSTSKIVDTNQAWTVDQYAGGTYLAAIVSGAGAGETRPIVSNTATELTVSPSFATLPNATSVYQILGQGFNQLATLTNPDSFILPREGTIKTGRDAAFVWCSSNAFAYLSWTYDGEPGSFPPVSVPVVPLPAGDILDPVLSMNGGAVIIPNIANANHRSPRVCFELALYDKKRGRFLTDGRLPAEAFVGGAFSNKLTPKQTRWNVDTEIEPRLLVTEVSMGPPLDREQLYSVANVAAYINVVFTGYNVLEERFNEADTFSAVKSRG